MTELALLGFSGSPKIGAEAVIGDPGGLAISFRVGAVAEEGAL